MDTGIGGHYVAALVTLKHGAARSHVDGTIAALNHAAERVREGRIVDLDGAMALLGLEGHETKESEITG